MKLYKYMDDSTALKFLDDPYFRITPRLALNDPFEVLLSGVTSEQLNTLSIQHNNELNNNFSTYFNNFMSSHGVISLSESYDNLLMWAHYAKDHKGLVIELDIDDINPFSIFNSYNIPKSSDACFTKVNYRKERHYTDNITPEKIERDVALHYYRTKSDEWIYEKEWRFIVPFNVANKILVNLNIKGSKQALEYLNISLDKKSGVVDITNQVNKADPAELKKLAVVFTNSHKNGFIFLVGLNEKKLRRLFLGINSNLDEIAPKLAHAFNSPYITYKSIIDDCYQGVYQATQHPNRFELVFNLFQGNKNSTGTSE
ncbi:DUF2971 domain-containing protein [Marinomonas sp.]|uniref:DUF2971 domain-containing protein n=1 Tax=Marinomonas sp. TaxID=1904862 RepID=UPI003A8F7EDE